jgi:peptidoglycan/LPS O-acetylase OafA/YrhL
MTAVDSPAMGRAGLGRAAPRRRTMVRLWLPLTPLFLLLAPFALLLAPLGYLAPPRLRPDPFFAVFAIGELLLALGGTDILVDTPDAYVRIKIL